jgi:type VI secretion system protein ImpA
MTDFIDIEALLRPLSPDAPCGANMEYSPEFAAVLAAAAGKPEQQMGDTIVPAVAPQWAEVVDRCRELLERSRDLRVAARLAQALLHVQGLSGFAAGLGFVRGCLDRYWSDVHPCLDADDGFDPAIRVTAVALLCSLAAVVHPLRDATPLLPALGGGAICLAHVLQARGGEPAADAGRVATSAEIDEAFASVPIEGLRQLVDVSRSACADARAIEATLSMHAGAGFVPDFDPLLKVLDEIHALASDRLAPRAAAEAEVGIDTGIDPPDEAEVEPAGVAHTAPIGRSARGPVASRADALTALDDICRYFRDREPSHPVPILLGRARRWIEMDFMDLLRDFAPEAVAEAEKLHGARRAH